MFCPILSERLVSVIRFVGFWGRSEVVRAEFLLIDDELMIVFLYDWAGS